MLGLWWCPHRGWQLSQFFQNDPSIRTASLVSHKTCQCSRNYHGWSSILRQSSYCVVNLAGSRSKNLPGNAGDIRHMVQSLGWKEPLEKDMATHSSVLTWRIPWTKEPGCLQTIGSQGYTWLKWHIQGKKCLQETMILIGCHFDPISFIIPNFSHCILKLLLLI